MHNGKFNEQVRVLLKCLPAIRAQSLFALKGGTAIQMTDSKVTIEDLFVTRDEMIKHLNHSLTQEERQFLISIKQGEPNFELMPFKNLNQLPSLKWKLINIKKMQKAKHQQMLDKLKSALQI
jgi:hypothetical protein